MIFTLLQQLDASQQQLFVVTLWSIWKSRNNKVWNNAVETTQQIGERAEAFLTSWKNAQRIKPRSQVTGRHQEATLWTKPVLGRFKCNVDAAFSPHLIGLVLELVSEMRNGILSLVEQHLSPLYSTLRWVKL